MLALSSVYMISNFSLSQLHWTFSQLISGSIGSLLWEFVTIWHLNLYWTIFYFFNSKLILIFINKKWKLYISDTSYFIIRLKDMCISPEINIKTYKLQVYLKLVDVELEKFISCWIKHKEIFFNKIYMHKY